MVAIKIDDQIILRSFKEEDSQALFDAVNNSRSHLHQWLNWVDKTTKPAHSLEFIENSLLEQFNQSGLALGIFLNGMVIGGIGLHNWDQNLKLAHVGYWIGMEHEGKGIITKCLLEFLDFLYCKIGLNKIEIRFVPSNKRSAGVAERLGFKTEGIIRQCVLNNGLINDLVITGLLKNEWEKKKKDAAV